LTRRAAVLIVLSDVDKVLLAEAAFSFAARGQRLGNEHPDARLLAGANLFPVEVASIGQHREFLSAHGFACTVGHARQLGAIMPDVGDLMGDNKMVLGVHRSLHVVTHHPGALAAGGHGTCIGIGQRNLFVWCLEHSHFQFLELAHLLLQARDLVLQPHALVILHL
jgi:hypothetical protein